MMLPTPSQPVTFEEDLLPIIPLYIPNDLTLQVSHEDSPASTNGLKPASPSSVSSLPRLVSVY
jgi:hypothetical protein